MPESPKDIRIQPVPNKGYLDDVFLMRHLAEFHLDALFGDAAVPDGMRLLLFNEVDAGLGDVAFATKLMRLLCCHVPQVEVVLVSSGPEKQAQFGLPDGVFMYEFKTYREQATAEHRQVDLIVSAPGIFDHCRSKVSVLATLGLSEDTPFIFIAEYGSMRQLRDDAFKPHRAEIESLVDTYLDEVAEQKGYDPETLGYRSSTGEVVSVVDGCVTPIGHLRAALASNRDTNPLWSWLVSPSLMARSAGFDTGEIGIFIEDDLRPSEGVVGGSRKVFLDDLKDGSLRDILGRAGKVEKESAEPSALYAGYAHSGQGYFLDYVALLEHAKSRPIDVVMPNARTVTEAYEAIFDPSLERRLLESGIGRVSIVGNSSVPGQVETFDKDLGEGKVLRLITRYPLPHSDMRTLLRASEPPTMVSGDQSFSEAVSAEKAVVVIEPVYCQTFHLDAQLELAERVSPELRLVLEFAMKYKWEDGLWEHVSRVIRSGRLSDHSKRYNDLIREQHRLNEGIVSVIKRALITASNPAVFDALKHIFTEAFESFSATDECLLKRSQMASLRELLQRRTGP